MSNTKNSKIAVTGAGGFLGNHLVQALKTKKINFSELDPGKHSLFKPKSLKSLLSGKDTIIHLAGVNRDSDLKLVRVNTLGTLGVLQAMVKYCPNAKIIFASSAQVYLKESLYGLSKRFAEELIENYTNRLKVRGVILRFSNIYGPGGKPFYNSVIATFIHLIKKSEALTIKGDGTQKRDYIYVDDVVEAILKAIFHEPENKTDYFDICSGKQDSLNSIIKILKKTSPEEVKVNYDKSGRPRDWKIMKDYEKAERLLDWRPETSLKEGLKKIIKSK